LERLPFQPAERITHTLFHIPLSNPVSTGYKKWFGHRLTSKTRVSLDMLFNQLPDLSQSIALEKASIQRLAEQLNLQGSQLAAIQAVVEWAQLLTTQTPEAFNQLRSYHQAIGNLPCAPTRNSSAYQRNPAAVAHARDILIEQLYSGSLSEQALINADVNRLKLLFTGLNKPQIELLQTMTAQRVNLETLDISSLTDQIPFPITQYNFFGRFLAGACETPQQAARHILLSTPFLIRLRSLFEGLLNNQLNFLQLDVISEPEVLAVQKGVKPPARAAISDETRNEVLEIVHVAINSAGDFYAGRMPGDKPLLRTITMPRLPDIVDDHIDPKQTSELSVALFDWLFFGSRSNELLHVNTLSSLREAQAQRRAESLKAKEIELFEHLAQGKPAQENSRNSREWKHKEKQILRQIERLENEIADFDMERARIQPIIKQLDAFTTNHPEIYAFRREIAAAQKRGVRIVFSFLGNRHSERAGNIFDFVDAAYNARRFQHHPAVKLLRSSSFLLSSEARRRIHAGRIPNSNSLTQNNLRSFEVAASDLNVSTRYLLGGILPRREDPRISSLLDTITEHMPPPGVASPDQLRRLVKLTTGKRAPTPGDYVTYTIERRSSLSEEQLLTIMNSLRQVKELTLPEKVIKIAVERFNHPPHLLKAYGKYAQGYQPNTLGTAPDIFTDQGSFTRYLNLGMDAMGMAPEVAEIQKHLVERGIVAVVDGTNYHPELDAPIEMIGEKLEKADSEKTDEIWGDYVRPSERVIRGLSIRLMEGDVAPELKNASLLGIIKPEKADQIVGKIVKKFYGLDMELTPDLTAINQVLADLKLHDENPILIIDAQSIRDMEQYRAFLSLLERYQVKTILRTREALPGIPQVNIQPFLPNSIADRIVADSDRLNDKLGLSKPVTRELLEFASAQVQRCRSPQHDPLNLTLQVLNTAASQARLQADKSMTERDIVAALAPIFHLPDGRQLQLRIAAINHFVEHAPSMVLGQEHAIKLLGSRIKSHLLRTRDENSPLTLLLPGPTGVGKTELMMLMAKVCDLPFFMIEGAEFSEEHSISRLVGSPSGYVGADEGILFTFLKENSSGLIFIDEIEKAHPSINQHLMNFYWRGTLTAGNGKTVTRPSFIIVGASNAGADQLRRDMDAVEVKQVLSEAFTDRYGRSRPELISRFEPIVMLAIEEPAFRQMLAKSLAALGSRSGFVNANLRLTGVDEGAIKLLYEHTKQVCEFREKGLKRTGKIGFNPTDIDSGTGLFYDLRHVNRAIDDLAGESIQELADAQYRTGAFAARDQALNVKLVGDVAANKIRAVPIRQES
jgi:hypothetical protein